MTKEMLELTDKDFKADTKHFWATTKTLETQGKNGKSQQRNRRHKEGPYKTLELKHTIIKIKN